MAEKIVPLKWEDNQLLVLDQLKLPGETTWIPCTTAEQVADTIRDMNVRGAPAIGVAAGYGVALGLRGKGSGAREAFPAVREMLAATRPTAVNLFWALDRMERLLNELDNFDELDERLVQEACAIRDEDEAYCRSIGEHGATLVSEKAKIITHCNAGALATAAYGTALGVIRAAHEQGKVEIVYCDETRPYLQGARLTAWELHEEEIPCRLICDNMPGSLMARGMVDLVVVGADRIAANGDVANKIGTYQLAILCKHHNIPFYVAAPVSTIDLEIKDGSQIPIEERSSEEVTAIKGVQIAPKGVQALHPAFDVTPADMITAIITDKGVLKAPYEKGLREVVGC
mgnify:FL=1